MGEGMDYEYTPNAFYCGYKSTIRDCDGDFFVRCNSSKNCPYKKVVRDCDGDYVEYCMA